MQQAEFDIFADEYYAQHKDNLKLSGESPEFFAEYKIKLLREFVGSGEKAISIMDFGCGVGNSIPHFRNYFPSANITGADVSSRSIDIAKERFSGNEQYTLLAKDSISIPDATFDVVFTACVFHHIPHSEHSLWLSELYRVTKSGGYFVIFEHNPYNPITVHMVNTCPFDVNAKLIKAGNFIKTAKNVGWQSPHLRYHLFFPNMLKSLRKTEKWLTWLPLGGQYSIVFRKN